MFPAHRPSIERDARQCEQHYPEDQIQEGQEQQREFNQQISVCHKLEWQCDSDERDGKQCKSRFFSNGKSKI